MDPSKNIVKSGNILEGITLEHTGTELSSTIITKDRSFEIRIGSKKIVVEIEYDMANIQYVMPSVEGTVILCQLVDNTQIFYDTVSGGIIKEPELRERDPQFYQ